jgi:hypothetical protein
MSILTSRELEFLASLDTGWRKLYWNELARLLKEDCNRISGHWFAPCNDNAVLPPPELRLALFHEGAPAFAEIL